MAAVTVHTDCGDQENKVCHCFHFFPIYLPWSDGTKCHDLHFWMLNFKPAFHTPLSSSSRGSLVPLCFLSLGWYHLHIWGCRPFSQKSWFQLVIIQSGISHVVPCNTQIPPQPVPSCLDKPSTSSLQLTEGTGHGKFGWERTAKYLTLVWVHCYPKSISFAELLGSPLLYATFIHLQLPEVPLLFYSNF